MVTPPRGYYFSILLGFPSVVFRLRVSTKTVMFVHELYLPSAPFVVHLRSKWKPTDDVKNYQGTLNGRAQTDNLRIRRRFSFQFGTSLRESHRFFAVERFECRWISQQTDDANLLWVRSFLRQIVLGSRASRFEEAYDLVIVFPTHPPRSCCHLSFRTRLIVGFIWTRKSSWLTR